MPRRAHPESAPDAGGWVCLAEIGRPKGVRGALRLICFGDDARALADRGALHLGPDGPPVSLRILESPAPGRLVVALEGVGDRDSAAALVGRRLFVRRSSLAPTAEDEFYHHDLIGLRVEGIDGRPLGRVAAVLDHGAGPLLDIAGVEGGRDFVLPFTREAAPRVDLAGRRLVADPPPGLIEDG